MNDIRHSYSGTSWAKKTHDYNKKINKRYYYSYESMLKKLWKMKKKADPNYEKLKAEYDKSKAERRAKVLADANKVKADAYSEKAKVRNYKLVSKSGIKKKSIFDIPKEALLKGKQLYDELRKKI